MKLRLRGNSIRIRLDRVDLDRLIAEGRVEDSLRLGLDSAFTYALELGDAPRGLPTARYARDVLTVRLDPDDAREWSQSARVGFEHLQPGEAGPVRILIEKDFACLDRSSGREDEDAHAFPNPSLPC